MIASSSKVESFESTQSVPSQADARPSAWDMSPIDLGFIVPERAHHEDTWLFALLCVCALIVFLWAIACGYWMVNP